LPLPISRDSRSCDQRQYQRQAGLRSGHGSPKHRPSVTFGCASAPARPPSTTRVATTNRSPTVASGRLDGLPRPRYTLPRHGLPVYCLVGHFAHLNPTPTAKCRTWHVPPLRTPRTHRGPRTTCPPEHEKTRTGGRAVHGIVPIAFEFRWAQYRVGLPREWPPGEARHSHQAGRRDARRWPRSPEQDECFTPPQGGEPERRRDERRMRRKADDGRTSVSASDSGSACGSGSSARERRVPENHQPWWRGLPARAWTTAFRREGRTAGRMPTAPWKAAPTGRRIPGTPTGGPKGPAAGTGTASATVDSVGARYGHGHRTRYPATGSVTDQAETESVCPAAGTAAAAGTGTDTESATAISGRILRSEQRSSLRVGDVSASGLKALRST
jgi:hypothetical protein